MKQKTLTTATLVASIMACGTAATNVQGQTSNPALNALVKKGILTEKEAKDALAAAEADFKKKPGPDVRVSWKDGLNFTSAGGLFKGKLGGRAQLDIASFKESDSAEARFGDIPTGVEFRRVRVSLEGEIGTALPMFFKTEYDFATSETQLKDVFVGIDKIPFVGRLQAGHFKEPLGLEVLTSSRFLTFMERATPMKAFLPERNIGVMASGAKLDEHLTYALGTFTDTGDSGKIVSAIDSNYRVSGRVSGLPWYDEASKGGSLLHVGASASYIDPGELRFRARPEAHLAPRFVDTGTNSAIFAGADHQILAALETAVVLGPFSAQAEYVRTWVNAPGVSPTFDWFYIFGSWFITGEHRNYRKSNGTFDRVVPHKSFTDGGIGAWELALRYSHVELNDEGINGGRLNDITAGVNWYLNSNSKIQVNYVNAMVDRGVTDGVARSCFPGAIRGRFLSG
jgi:phosphate-selective porin OprO/OprP